MRTLIFLTIATALFLTFYQQAAFAQDDVSQQLQNLAQRVNQLESKESELLTIAHREAGGGALFLFGAFCALFGAEHRAQRLALVFLGIVV